MKLKQLFCKHKNTKEIFIYRDDFRYNDFFKEVIVTRNKVVICEDCNKILNTIYAEIISLEELKKEVMKDV
jgi:hypothetical protein